MDELLLDGINDNEDENYCFEATMENENQTMKGLESLEIIKVRLSNNATNKMCLKTIEKELKDYEEMKTSFNAITCENGNLLKYKKAFEFIKNNCEIELDKEYGYYYLNISYDYGYDLGSVCIKLSQEEYALLKEVLL